MKSGYVTKMVDTTIRKVKLYRDKLYRHSNLTQEDSDTVDYAPRW